MDTLQSKSEIIELIRIKISDIHIATFITVNQEGAPCARPMATQEIDNTGCITFMTSSESKKVHEIKNNPKITLSYTAGNDITFVSLTGHASLNEDREKINQIWNPFHEAWFDGPSDPTITLIEVVVSRFEYWDYVGGKVGAYVDMALAALTGRKAERDDTGVFSLQ